jgi:uncharacterized membrane protein
MIDRLVFPLTLVAALGSGLIAGLLYAFSVSIMKALSRLPAPQGIAAMQSINVVILNPVFLGTFMGTALVCLMLAVLSVSRWQLPGAGYLLAGSALYLIGTIAMTMMYHVPLNNALAAVQPETMEAATLWKRYLANWTAMNHVRTAAALAASAAFSLALRASAASGAP